VIDRSAFAAARGVDLDPFQVRACDALDRGHSVLVAAPTGSGKTLVAEYAIEAALDLGAKAFYTTPLKALSNQKFADFGARYGRECVGLLTGDNTINGEARIVVMTTEVLRNMIYAASPTLDGLGVVVLDEVHYLQDRFRGPVWEEVIVHLDHTVPLVCLSATVSNAVEVAEWIATVRGPTEPVVEEQRPVELRDLYVVAERGRDGLTMLPTFVDAPRPTKDGRAGRRPNPDALRLGRGGGGGGGPRPRARGRLRTPMRDEVVELLDRERMLPAIVFVFSRAGCDQAVDHARAAAVRLTTPEERSRIREIAEAHTANLADDELEVLRYGSWLDALEAGIAAHHAGLVPPLKEAVEEAFTEGLVKVVYATETLALGVNMPARTVVIEKLTKFTGERHEFLTAGEYTQLTGRAGRRGIDDVGHALVCWSPFVTFDQVASLASRGSDPLVSAFRPTYNMAANLVARYDRDTAHRLLNSSFAQFRADRDVVTLERELSRAIARRDRVRAAQASDGGRARDVEPPASDRRAVERAIDRLQPGDVVLVGRRNTRMVVIAHAGGRGRGEGRGGRVLAVDPGRDVRRLGADDFGAPPEAVAHVELPEPYAPRSPAFRRMVADAARRAPLRAGNGEGTPSPRETARDRAGDRRAASASALARHEREVQRLERRVRARSEHLASQFDRVLALLESWRYVDEWTLTEGGHLLARLSHECDLLIAEAIRDGAFRNLTAAELAAVVSCFTYEKRGPDDTRAGTHVRWPSNRVAAAVRAIERRWRDLNAAEDDHRLPATRPVDPGFVDPMFEWARGDTLAHVLDDELSAGDFVRQVKQCIDVLRQIADVDPDPAVAATARESARACLRGVVAVASAVGGQTT
jgi:ATP-dependent RNA helicase HelY